jgi:hypothetical protein
LAERERAMIAEIRAGCGIEPSAESEPELVEEPDEVAADFASEGFGYEDELTPA